MKYRLEANIDNSYWVRNDVILGSIQEAEEYALDLKIRDPRIKIIRIIRVMWIFPRVNFKFIDGKLVRI